MYAILDFLMGNFPLPVQFANSFASGKYFIMLQEVALSNECDKFKINDK